MADSDDEALAIVRGGIDRLRQPRPSGFVANHCARMRAARGGQVHRSERGIAKVRRDTVTSMQKLLPTAGRNEARVFDSGQSINLGGHSISAVGMLRGSFGVEGSWNTASCLDHQSLRHASGSSERSVKASQIIVADGIMLGVREGIADIVARKEPVLVLKRVWDEATFFFNMGRSELKAILGDFADRCIERLPKLLKNRAINAKPCLTAQILQQKHTVRWGCGPSCCELVMLPGKLLPTNNSQWMYACLQTSLPELCGQQLATCGFALLIIMISCM